MVKACKTNTVIVIEDEVDIRMFICRVLELEGYHVLQAEDGDAGLRLAKQSQVALVMLDLHLPGRSGWEVLQELRTDSKVSQIPVIVITASVGVDQCSRALSLGAADYLVKPMSASDLTKACADVLRRRE